jgi:hypothetical protein
VCRPIGLKFLVDSTWQVNLYDYQKHQTFVTIVPPAIKNKEGREITYTIAMIIRVAQSGEELENYVDNFIAQYPDKNKFDISDKYPGMISFEIKNENMYQDMGGAHMHMVGIKRERPKYAGLLLEQPMSIHQEDENKLTFYRARESKDRFDGDIYYAVMLDACEDIYDEAYRVFKEIFEKQLIIE